MSIFHFFSQLKDTGCLMAFNVLLVMAWLIAGFAWVIRRISRQLKTFFSV